MNKSHIISAGSLVPITTGEYDDYMIHGIFRALVDIDPEKLSEAYFTEHPDQKHPWYFETEPFIVWLIKENIVEDLVFVEWNLSDIPTNPRAANTEKSFEREIQRGCIEMKPEIKFMKELGDLLNLKTLYDQECEERTDMNLTSKQGTYTIIWKFNSCMMEDFKELNEKLEEKFKILRSFAHSDNDDLLYHKLGYTKDGGYS